MQSQNDDKDILKSQLQRVNNDPSVYARTEELDIELEKRRQIIELELEARKKLQEDLEHEVDEQIKVIQEYLNLKMWRQALTKLKFLYDSSNVPRNKKAAVEKLYVEAHLLMEEVRKTDPSVPLFSHFNLPTTDVM